jgi:serine/threonine protein kinase
MNYSLIGHIASGGYGKVEKVQGEDGIFYARKTFQIDAKAQASGFEENAKKRFIQEAKYQSDFNHKNIVPVIDLFVNADPPCFIMPLAEGSLESDKRSGFISSKKFPEAIFDILLGLEELHTIEIYHRDLKPSNVLRFKNLDGTFYYAISDFGLMSLQQGSDVTALTSTTMGKTSDFYTAPEITQHLHNADITSDIYSIGCIIHDFVGTGPRYPCNEIVDQSDYGDILSICTKQDPNKRFKSVASLRDVLVSIDKGVFGPKTEVNQRITEILKGNQQKLTEDKVNEIINFFQSSDYDTFDKLNVLLEISLDNILSIKKLPNLMQFALIYTEFIKNGTFQFNSCDALASRLNALIEGEGINIKVHGLMALLFLGTNHNRFYVERLFASKVGPDADFKLIKRLKLEFNIEEDRICSAINHLGYSIGFSIDDLHPILKDTYNKFCS